MWYRFHHVSLPPQNAVSACANDNGGRLMYIDSSSRQQFIEQVLAEGENADVHVTHCFKEAKSGAGTPYHLEAPE